MVASEAGRDARSIMGRKRYMQPAEVVDAGNGRQYEERSCHCPDEGLRRFEI
jgi:hypothetical protein